MVSYATTEPDAGSDVAGMQCRAVKQSDGELRAHRHEGVDHQREPRALLRHLRDREPGAQAQGHRRVHRRIATRRASRVGKHEDKLGQRASDTAQVMLDGVHVPAAQVLAPPGHGFKVAMETFNQTRPDIGAIAVGLMRRCLDESRRLREGAQDVRHGRSRTTSSCRRCSPRWRSASRPRACSSTRRRGALDKGIRDPLTSSLAKAYGADAAMASAIDAVQVFGGNGYVKEYPVEKLMRDAKILQIYEGTAQIQRIVIAKQLLA